MDFNPGDRAEICRGFMEPVKAHLKNGRIVLVHRCLKCKIERHNRSAPEDSLEKILEIMKQQRFESIYLRGRRL